MHVALFLEVAVPFILTPKQNLTRTVCGLVGTRTVLRVSWKGVGPLSFWFEVLKKTTGNLFISSC